MPRLHLPSDACMMPVRCPNHPFLAAAFSRSLSMGRVPDDMTELLVTGTLKLERRQRSGIDIIKYHT